jgi:hypothetical protein
MATVQAAECEAFFVTVAWRCINNFSLCVSLVWLGLYADSK